MRKFIQIQSILLLLLIAAFFAVLPAESNAGVKDMWDELPPQPVTISDRK